MQPKDTSTSGLYTYLKKFHLSDSLILIGAINAALKYGTKDLWKEGVEREVILWLEKNCKTYQNFLTIYIDTGRLARYLLISGANDYRDKRLKLNDDTFNIALNMTGAVYDTKIEQQLMAESGSRGLLARISQRQFPLQGDQRALIGRGYLLFIELAERYKDNYDLQDKMMAYHGIGAFEFMATGMMIWIKTNGYECYRLDMQISNLKETVSDQNQEKFLQLSSGSAEEYRKLIRGENWKVPNAMKDTYGHEGFLRMPAVVIQNSSLHRSGAYAIPQAWYLLQRTSSGIFYLLADKEKEYSEQTGQAGRNPFRREFGLIYRDYVKYQLDQPERTFDLIDLDEDFNNHLGISIPDFALVDAETCLLFEVKTTLLTVNSRSYFDPALLREEIQAGSLKKAVQQLDKFATAILQGKFNDRRFSTIKRVVKIIIGYEDVFVLNTLLLPMLETEYGAMADNLQMGSVSDIEVIGTIISKGENISRLICEKVDDKEKRYNAFIASWEKHYGRENPVLKKSFDRFLTRLAGQEIGADT